jgi:hypothetical protein
VKESRIGGLKSAKYGSDESWVEARRYETVRAARVDDTNYIESA